MKKERKVIEIRLKSLKSQKSYCFVKTNLINRFGKENFLIDQKYTRNTKLVLLTFALHIFEQLLFVLCILS